MKHLISRIRSSLEAVPGDVQLADYNKRAQLAFWLNLYNVTRALQHNAPDFVNSKRGSFIAGKRGYRVSGFYQRCAAFFPNFDQHLKQHLLGHIRDDKRADLQQAAELKANIDDWSVTDIYGTTRNYGGAAATNSAALLDSFSPAARAC